MDVKDTRELITRDAQFRRYFRYILMHHYLRLILIAISFATLIILIKQGKYVNIEKYEVNIIVFKDNEILQDMKPTFINISELSSKKEISENIQVNH